MINRQCNELFETNNQLIETIQIEQHRIQQLETIKTQV